MTLKGKRVLITGGLGFIGSTLAHHLISKEAHVTLLDARLPSYGSNPANIDGIREEVDIIEADVRDYDAITGHVSSSDVVYHLAAQLSRPVSNERPDVDAAINCEGFLNVLSAAESAESPPRVVFTSSQAVVGTPPSLPFDETTPANPRDIYGANKRAGELYCDVFHSARDVPTVAVRLTNVYGPRAQLRNPNYGVINKFLAKALQDETLTVFEPGTMERDFIHVEDVASGLILLGTEKRAVGERYVMGSGQGTTIKELAHLIVDRAGSGTVEVVPWPEDWDSIRVGDLRAEPSKMTEHFGWSAKTQLENGIETTLAYYREYQSSYL